MPGLTILRMTTSPSIVVARWIWPIEAEPMRSLLDVRENLRARPPDLLLEQLQEALVGDCRQPVEKVLELVGDRPRQQVLTQAQDLAELDVGRPEDLQTAPQLLGKGQVPHVLAEARAGDAAQRELQPVDEAVPARDRPVIDCGAERARENPGHMAEGREVAPHETGRLALDEQLVIAAAGLGLPGPGFRGTAAGVTHGRGASAVAPVWLVARHPVE